MKKEALIAGLTVLATITVISIWSLGMKGTLGVWNANIDREIFENNKTFIHGTIQNFNDLKLQYQTAKSEGHKSAIREAILNDYSAFPHKDKLPSNIKLFIENL